MPRVYKKKGTRVEFSEADMQKAVEDVIENNYSLRTAAERNNVKHTALFYRLKKRHLDKDYTQKYHTNQVFSITEEEELQKYLLKSSRINYGLTYESTRKLAYEYAKKIKKKIPESWHRDNKAGIEWMKGFMLRHRQLSLRKPENTSLSRATSFNRSNVSAFFENYIRVMEKFAFREERIFNLDETGIMTVVQAPYVIAGRGIKQVGQCVSGERGKLVTMCSIISASGTPVPPVLVFPRARMVDTLMNGAPSGSTGHPNSPDSGWMTSKIFLKVLGHLQHFTRCSNEDPILLLMDNHESHCNLESILFAKENGIVLLTFPPHCSHRLQPLDVGVLGPFKGKFKIASNDWLLNHPGRTITIHNIMEIVGIAYAASFTIHNIQQGFKKPGIWPINRNAFTDEDFDSSFVTDRPDPSLPLESETQMENNLPSVTDIDGSSTQFKIPTVPPGNIPSTSQISTGEHLISNNNGQSNETSLPSFIPSTSKVQIITPEQVKPFPKVTTARKIVKAGRKPGSTKVLTDTPVKDEIENNYIDKIVKKVLQQITKNKRNQNCLPKTKKKDNDLESKIIAKIMDIESATKTDYVGNIERANKVKKQVLQSSEKTNTEGSKHKIFNVKRKVLQTSSRVSSSSESSSDENEDSNISLHDSSSDNDIMKEIVEDEIENVLKNEFVLVKFPLKKSIVHYVAQVEENQFTELFVNFLRNKGDYTFGFPDIQDSSNVVLTDVVMKLPQPTTTGGTLRATKIFKFPGVDFSTYNMR